MFVWTFCLESHILSFPKVLQIPPESPCMSWHGTDQRYKTHFLLKSSESVVKSHYTFMFVGLYDSYYCQRRWKWRQANPQIGWTCADLIKLMKPEGTERGREREISDSLTCHFRAWMTQCLLNAHIKTLVNLRWAPSFMKVTGAAACISASSGLR